MKKFKFSLASLLRVKLLLEKEKKAQVAQVAARLRNLEAELVMLEAQRENTANTMRDKMRSNSSASELNNFSSFLSVMRSRIRDQHNKINTVSKELEARQIELTELMRERKMLEKLKEKQYTQYLKELALEQAKEIDDYTSYTSYASLN